MSADARFVQLEVVPDEGTSPESLTRLVESLRAATAEGLTGLRASRMWVGGLPAFNADFEAAVVGRFVSVAGLVIGATLLMLMIGFRSVLIPLKAVALNLLSVAGAFGALVLVFQDGHGAHLMGLSSVPGSVFPMVPVLVFCVVFGLSMDYEVFLVARVAEARRTLDERAAVAEGLARTGHVITSAAAIMIVVFGGFTLGDFVLVKMLGFAVAVAVLIDAAVVRVAIGPALLVLLGRWNWWPAEHPSPGQAHASQQIPKAPLAAKRVIDGPHSQPSEIRRAQRSSFFE
jgi:RND superfamily putative drug exporter